MAHKCCVNGTAYEIVGGRCCVDGTGHDVISGRSMVNGTVYDVSFGSGALTVTITTSWPQVTKFIIGGIEYSYTAGNISSAGTTIEVPVETVIEVYGYRHTSATMATSCKIDENDSVYNDDAIGYVKLEDYKVTSDCTIDVGRTGGNTTVITITTL